jgi:hypothetical protein
LEAPLRGDGVAEVDWGGRRDRAGEIGFELPLELLHGLFAREVLLNRLRPVRPNKVGVDGPRAAPRDRWLGRRGGSWDVHGRVLENTRLPTKLSSGYNRSGSAAFPIIENRSIAFSSASVQSRAGWVGLGDVLSAALDERANVALAVSDAAWAELDLSQIAIAG